jgi:hypothetical protein
LIIELCGVFFLKLSKTFGRAAFAEASPLSWARLFASAKLITDFKIKFDILVWKNLVIEELMSGPKCFSNIYIASCLLSYTLLINIPVIINAPSGAI